MKLKILKAALSKSPEAYLRFLLPDGSKIPAHAHVTEAARIDKKFIDCGGTLREASYCRLQTWVADDLDHRLTAGKLLGILTKADSIPLTEELDVDIEHELTFISQFSLEDVAQSGSEITLKLAARHTACLAPELCCPPTPEIVTVVKRIGR
jgi:hypothetical protein